MSRSIFSGTLMLTGVNLLLRFAGTSFQVYLSRRIGAAGIGLLQLVMSVGNLTLVAGMGGIRTSAIYLTAEELGRNRPGSVRPVLSACIFYSILFSCLVSLGLMLGSPYLAAHWIHNSQTVPALRLFGAFLPVVCLCGVMSGYFTAAKRIGTLAIVEIIEQFCSILTTMLLLVFWVGKDTERACLAVIMGSSAGACVTLISLISLRVKEHAPSGTVQNIRSRLMETALPLAAADLLRSGISTTEHLLVPRRLSLFPGETDPLAAFGQVSGMVFPVMMFPACILFAMAELLIPELASCRAADRQMRIQHLVRQGLRVALLYGVLFGGLLWLLALPLCTALYHSAEAGLWLRRFSVIVPFLYCDAIVDAMTKGLGQQKICVRFNIVTSALDTILLFLFLPRYGMAAYYWCFVSTHLINFVLSLHLLLRISGVSPPFRDAFLSMLSGIAAAAVSMITCIPLYPFALLFLLTLFHALHTEDYAWFTRNLHIPLPYFKKFSDPSRNVVQRSL